MSVMMEAQVDRVGRQGSGGRGSQYDRRKVNGSCLIDDDLLDGSITWRTPADHCTEDRYGRNEIPQRPVCLGTHVHSPRLT